MVEISRSRNMSLMQSIRDGTEPERGLGAVSQRCIYGSNLLRCSEFLKGKEMVVSSVKGRDYFAGRSLNEIRICRRMRNLVEQNLNEKERERLERNREKMGEFKGGFTFHFVHYIDYFIFPRTYKIQEKKGEGGIRG